MCNERTVKIRTRKHQRIAVGLETHPASEVSFQQFAMPWAPGQFQPKRCDLALSASVSDGEDPCQDHVHEHVGLRFGSFDIEELHRGFFGILVHANFFRARQFFISAEPLQSVAKGVAAHHGNSRGMGTFHSCFGAEL